MIKVGDATYTVGELSLGQCLQVFLMTSYQYYHRYESLIEDQDYDAIAKKLLNHWDDFDHQHKYLVTPGDLRAGTLYAVKKEVYPTMIVQASETWAREKFYTDTQQGADVGQ